MPPPALQTPPAIVTPAPEAPDAESVLLEAYDWGRPLPKAPSLEGAAALEYQYLLACATFDAARDLPQNPFVSGPKQREVEALKGLLQAPRAQLANRLKDLPLRATGTALALWRWGQLQVRSGGFDRGLRRSWEDRLLNGGPALTRGYALRHALCWALAEQDDARFTRIRAAAGDGAMDLQGFQRLFGLLGGPSPVLRLWTLPGLAYRDLRLDQLGASRIWIGPLDEGPIPTLPADTSWVIPSATGILDEREANLPELLLTEGGALADRLGQAGRSAFLAPSAAAFERLGLVWFPILIELDSKGNLRSVRMGDAAPAKP
jgi:hypothetical protein